jgi:hypothetical protein
MHGMHRLCAAGFAAVVLAASAVTGETASAATAAWWHMNEASGTTMHDAVGSADGILHKVALNRPGSGAVGPTVSTAGAPTSRCPTKLR